MKLFQEAEDAVVAAAVEISVISSVAWSVVVATVEAVEEDITTTMVEAVVVVAAAVGLILYNSDFQN